MPNWCYTDSVIYGNSEDIMKFKILYDTLLEEERRKNKADSLSTINSTEINTPEIWLGYFIEYFDSRNLLKKESSLFMNDYSCRGSITMCEYKDNNKKELLISYYSAWGPTDTFWERLFSEKFPSLKIVGISEEPNTQLYINTDENKKYFKDKYHLTINSNSCFNTYSCKTKKEVLDKIYNDIGHRFKSFSDLNKNKEAVLNRLGEIDEEEYYIEVIEYSE